MKFRKKPVIIDAFQMTKNKHHNNWPVWAHEAWSNNPREKDAIWVDQSNPTHERLLCGTLTNPHVIDWDDWIIKDMIGKIYPMKPDIFEIIYEEMA